VNGSSSNSSANSSGTATTTSTTAATGDATATSPSAEFPPIAAVDECMNQIANNANNSRFYTARRRAVGWGGRVEYHAVGGVDDYFEMVERRRRLLATEIRSGEFAMRIQSSFTYPDTSIYDYWLSTAPALCFIIGAGFELLLFLIRFYVERKKRIETEEAAQIASESFDLDGDLANVDKMPAAPGSLKRDHFSGISGGDGSSLAAAHGEQAHYVPLAQPPMPPPLGGGMYGGGPEGAGFKGAEGNWMAAGQSPKIEPNMTVRPPSAGRGPNGNGHGNGMNNGGAAAAGADAEDVDEMEVVPTASS